MSLTPDLAHERAHDDGQKMLDLPVDAVAGMSQLNAPRTRTERDLNRSGRASDRIDAALEQMQDFLSVMHPTTDAEALHSLRLAFPTVPLTDRIAAIKTRFFA